MSATVMSMPRRKIALYLGVNLTFVAVALLLLRHPHPGAWKLQLCLGFFGLGSVTFVGSLIRPLRLLLDDEGFTMLGGFIRSPKKVHWHDIDEFFIYRLRGAKLIGFNYKPGAPEVPPMARFSRSFGADGGLPNCSAWSPEKMVAELNTCRLRAADTGTPTVANV